MLAPLPSKSLLNVLKASLIKTKKVSKLIGFYHLLMQRYLRWNHGTGMMEISLRKLLEKRRRRGKKEREIFYFIFNFYNLK